MGSHLRFSLFPPPRRWGRISTFQLFLRIEESRRGGVRAIYVLEKKLESGDTTPSTLGRKKRKAKMRPRLHGEDDGAAGGGAEAAVGVGDGGVEVDGVAGGELVVVAADLQPELA